MFPLWLLRRLSLEGCDASWGPSAPGTGQIPFLWCGDIWQGLGLEQVLLNPRALATGIPNPEAFWGCRTWWVRSQKCCT